MSTAMRKPVIVAGILLEWTPVEVALRVLSLTRTELEKVLAASPEWPFPASLDGWKLSHDAIRYDMEALQIALDTTKSQVYDGKALAQWQVDALVLVVDEFHRVVHKHHENEEQIFFPWLETRVRLPPKMSADHLTLTALLDQVKDLCEGLRPVEAAAAKAPLDKLCTAFSRLRIMMRQHLEEEEIIGLPLLRLHFTAKEAEMPERRIITQMKPCDIAWLLRPMDMEDKKLTLSRLRVSGMAQRLAILPAIRKDERVVQQAYRDLRAGQRGYDNPQQGFKAASSGRGLLSCFVV